MGFVPEKYGGEILGRFGLDETSLIGEGWDSRVFSVDRNHVLRIYQPGVGREYIESVDSLLKRLDTSEVCFRVPEILEIGEHDGLNFVVEVNLGKNMEHARSYLSPTAWNNAFEGFVDAIGKINKLVDFDINQPYGELVTDDAVTAPDWVQFMFARVEKSLSISKTELQHVSQLDELIKVWKNKIVEIGNPKKSLVHCDFHAGNVLVDDETGDITAVIDFNRDAVVGDWRLDIVSCSWSGLFGGFDADDQRKLDQMLAQKYSIDKSIYWLYEVYLCLYYSKGISRSSKLKDWCTQTLNKSAASMNEVF